MPNAEGFRSSLTGCFRMKGEVVAWGGLEPPT